MVCRKLIRPNHRNGFSLIELIVAVASAMVLILGMGIILTHSQRDFTRMFKRAHSDVVEDAYAARRVFDRVVRKATSRRCDLDPINGSWIYVYYYSDTPAAPDRSLEDPDSCARFYVQGDKLFVDYSEKSIPAGAFNEDLNPTTLPVSGSVRLARDVQLFENVPLFSVKGTTVRMSMLLDNEKETMLVASSAVRHNK